MKTQSFYLRRFSMYPILGFLSLLLFSWGASQNTSTYDNDGIYGNSGRNPNTTSQNSDYKNYFGSLQDNQPDQIFTDVDNYNSNYDNSNSNDNNESYRSGNAGWGSNPDNVTVNVYGNN